MHRECDSGYCDCFFFQAEDGIRDLYVTGVQTCALPIFLSSPAGRSGSRPFAWASAQARSCPGAIERSGPSREIGRASCRERVLILVVGVSLNKKKLQELARAR